MDLNVFKMMTSFYTTSVNFSLGSWLLFGMTSKIIKYAFKTHVDKFKMLKQLYFLCTKT